jgi:hypothetical protein
VLKLGRHPARRACFRTARIGESAQALALIVRSSSQRHGGRLVMLWDLGAEAISRLHLDGGARRILADQERGLRPGVRTARAAQERGRLALLRFAQETEIGKASRMLVDVPILGR